MGVVFPLHPPTPRPLNFLSLLRSDRARRITLTRKREFNEKHTEFKNDLSPLSATSVDPAGGRIEGPRSSWNLKFYFLDLFAGRKVVDKAFFFLGLKYSFENCSYIINDWIYPTWPQITLQTLGQLHFEKKINKKLRFFWMGNIFFISQTNIKDLLSKPTSVFMKCPIYIDISSVWSCMYIFIKIIQKDKKSKR